jgi:hypothetical protein
MPYHSASNKNLRDAPTTLFCSQRLQQAILRRSSDMVFRRRKAIFSRVISSNNHALMFFQGITAAQKDDRKKNCPLA